MATKKPITHNGDLGNLPAALLPLVKRPQWAAWQWFLKDGKWQKPPVQARRPQCFADNDPATWASYKDAVNTVNNGQADGLTFFVTETDGLAAIDVDHCRDPDTGKIEDWAGYLITRATELGAYVEATPSGTGIRVWGTCNGDAKPLFKPLDLDHGEGTRIELYRKRVKPLTITGYDLNCGSALPDIGRLFDWAIDHHRRHKRKKPKPEISAADERVAHEPSQKAPQAPWEASTVDEIDALLRGPLPNGVDRSAEFMRVVGHYHGIGWTFQQVVELLAAYPNGVAQKYADRLEAEARRCWDKFEAQDQANDGLFDAKAIETPLVWAKLSEWDNRILPEREWAVHERLPLRAPVLFSGPGGAGKSTLGLQLAADKVLGKAWLGTLLEAGPAACIDCEDELNEMLHRLKRIAEYHEVKFADLERCGLHVQSWAADSDTVLAVPGRRGGRLEPTKLFGRLRQALGDIKPKITVIASSANVFAGNEIDRAHVQQFMKMLSSLCHLANGTIVLISHPSIRGLETDSGLSGNTAWDSGVRARMFLKPVLTESGPDPLRRELVFKKNQYAVLGEAVPLQYRNGLWLPEVAAADKTATDAACDEFNLKTLAMFNRRGTRVSLSPFATKNYAAKVFAALPEARAANFTQAKLGPSLIRLFDAGRIRNEEWKATKSQYLIVVTEDGGGSS